MRCPSDGHTFEVDPSELERTGGETYCPMCGVRITLPTGTIEVEGQVSDEVARVSEQLFAQHQRAQPQAAPGSREAADAASESPRRTAGGGGRRRPLLEWLVAAVAVAAVVAWFGWSPSYTSGGVVISVVGLAVTGAIAISAWPKTKEAGIAATLVGVALAAIGTGTGIAALGGGHEAGQQNATARPPHLAAQKAPSSLPRSGPTLKVSNKVTDGAKLMRDDDAHPAYLSTVMRNFCKSAGCAISGTDLFTGDTVGPVICQGRGERVTNGDDSSAVDDNNPGLYSSNRWYGARRRDGTVGYISEVWIAPSQRGGLGLPRCPHT